MTEHSSKEELEFILKHLGWSHRKLGRELYLEEDTSHNDEDMASYEEKVRKSFQRKTTRDEVFEQYLNTLRNHYEFKKLNVVFPEYHSTKILDEKLERLLKQLSIEISKDLRSKDDL